MPNEDYNTGYDAGFREALAMFRRKVDSGMDAKTVLQAMELAAAVTKEANVRIVP